MRIIGVKSKSNCLLEQEIKGKLLEKEEIGKSTEVFFMGS